jgi:hypothetical protein
VGACGSAPGSSQDGGSSCCRASCGRVSAGWTSQGSKLHAWPCVVCVTTTSWSNMWVWLLGGMSHQPASVSRQIQGWKLAAWLRAADCRRRQGCRCGHHDRADGFMWVWVFVHHGLEPLGLRTPARVLCIMRGMHVLACRLQWTAWCHTGMSRRRRALCFAQACCMCHACGVLRMQSGATQPARDLY